MNKVRVSNNVKRFNGIYPNDTKVSAVIAESGLDAPNAMWHINGQVIDPEELDMTFEDLGFEDNTSLFVSKITKADNA